MTVALLRHAVHDRVLPNLRPDGRRPQPITLPHRPWSADRAWSPTAVSQKWEFFKYPPETVGYFALRTLKIGA
jgi:hypothetical protein